MLFLYGREEIKIAGKDICDTEEGCTGSPGKGSAAFLRIPWL
jgi:hypothetical protein